MSPSAEDVVAAVDIDCVTRQRTGVVACQKYPSGAQLSKKARPYVELLALAVEEALLSRWRTRLRIEQK